MIFSLTRTTHFEHFRPGQPVPTHRVMGGNASRPNAAESRSPTTSGRAVAAWCSTD
ncbi:MAG: hypothetical protein K1X78_12140 [Verrucomicrobiaceae bacterium]|nr:hypothetical protein [Verrucomicrobiaceae bacterium]